MVHLLKFLVSCSFSYCLFCFYYWEIVYLGDLRPMIRLFFLIISIIIYCIPNIFKKDSTECPYYDTDSRDNL